MTIFLPLLFGGPVFGVVVPSYEVPDGHFYNYIAQCELSENYWAMIWDARGYWPLPDETCEGKPLLILNEPEQADQANHTPAQGAALLYEWRGWDGPLYCCGNLYQQKGWAWFAAMAAVYSDTYGLPLPIDGLHIHVYPVSVDALDRAQLQQWRRLTDANGWEIAVTEIGLLPVAGNTPGVIAAALPALLDSTIAELQPEALFWFAWTVHPILNTPAFRWSDVALHTQDGHLTPVGAAWNEYQEHRGGWGE